MSEQDEPREDAAPQSKPMREDASPSPMRAPSSLQSDSDELPRLAYSIIQNLLEHTRVTSDLVALMAQVLDEDTTRAVTNTPYWSAYLDSRRTMERTREEMEKFTEIMRRLGEQDKD